MSLAAARSTLWRTAARRATAARRRTVTTHSQLPQEHKMVYEMCRKFANEELAPHAGKWDQKHEFPQQAVQHLVRVGVCLFWDKHCFGVPFGRGQEKTRLCFWQFWVSTGIVCVCVRALAEEDTHWFCVSSF